MGFCSTASNPSFAGVRRSRAEAQQSWGYKPGLCPGLDTLGLKLRLGFDQAFNPQLKLSWGLVKKKPIIGKAFFK
jgi:hypothetical protein